MPGRCPGQKPDPINGEEQRESDNTKINDMRSELIEPDRVNQYRKKQGTEGGHYETEPGNWSSPPFSYNFKIHRVA